jgi:nucleoside-diphosphate-sugar epimerase
VKIAITGANGFVGKAVVRAAQMQGHVVVSLVRAPSGLPGEQIIADLNSGSLDPALFAGCDAVIHLVARTHISNDRAADPLAAYRKINVDGTGKILAAAALAGVAHIIYMSSVKAAGERTVLGRPLTAQSSPHPEDAYGITKLEAENLVRSYCNERGMGWTIIRPPLVYGPGVQANFARLISFAARGIPLPLAGIANRRSIIYVGNLADATIRALSEKNAQNQTLMLCDNTVSTAALVRVIAKHLSARDRIFAVPPILFGVLRRLPKMARLLDRLIGSLEIDPQPSMRLMNWSPPVDTDEAIRRTVARWTSDKEGRSNHD